MKSKRTGLNIPKEKKNKFTTNIDTSDDIQIDVTEIEKMINYKHLGQTIAIEMRTWQDVSIRIKP